MDKIIKNRKRKALTVLIVTFILAGVLSFANAKQVKQIFSVFKTNSAPLVTSYDELVEALETHDTVRMELPYLDDSGYYYGKETNIKQSLGISVVGEQFLIVIQDGKTEAMRLFDYPETVMLTKDRSATTAKALNMMVEDYAEYANITTEESKAYFFPTFMKLEGIRSNTYFYLGSLATILVVGIGFYFYRSNKMMKDLGKKFTSEEMDLIDYEIKNAVFETKSMILTKTYIVALGYSNINKLFLKISDIAWVYKNVTTHRTNGIKTGTTYQVKVFLSGQSGAIDIQLIERDVDTVLEMLHGMSHSMVIGYYEGGLQLWSKNRNYVDFKRALFGEESLEESSDSQED